MVNRVSVRTLALRLVLGAAVGLSGMVAPVSAAVLSAPALYADALGKEAAVRRALDEGAAAASVGRAVRTVFAAFESVLRHYPTSGYCDDALWRAAQLATDAAARLKDPALRAAAQRYLKRLTKEYPSSKYARQASDATARLAVSTPPARAEDPAAAVSDTAHLLDHVPAAVGAAPPTRQAVPPAGASATAPTGNPPRANAGLSVVATPTVTSPESPTVASDTRISGPARLLAVRRTLLPEAVRITLDVDREVLFRQDRLTGPDRIYFDLADTTSSRTLADRTIRFDGDADVIRHVRIGQPSGDTVRVVLDATGVAACSASPLYEPYRLVVDCLRERRPTPARPAASNAPESARPTPLTPATFARKAPGEGSARAPRPPATPAAAMTRPLAPVARPLLPLAGRETVPFMGVPPVLYARALQVPSAVALPIGPSPVPSAVLAALAAEPATPVDAAPASNASAPAAPPTVPPAVPARNLDGGFSLARQLGLSVSRIVIDPGHGGHDPGARADGTTEAAVVLDIALRLEKLLQQEEGVEVILTRRTDEFVPLEERTAIANRASADLFLSIHTNASTITQAAGIETYYLNFANTASAATVAARENASSGQPMSALPEFVKAIAMNGKQDESRDFAAQVQRALIQKLRPSNRHVRDLGVKQAPFVVLVGASMPSVLAEVSFLTNDQEARLLKGQTYRQRIAEALLAAVQRYQSSLGRGRDVTNQ